jgi:hypothetical protein
LLGFLSNVISIEITVGLIKQFVPVNLVEFKSKRNKCGNPHENISVPNFIRKFCNLVLQLFLHIFLKNNVLIIGEIISDEQEAHSKENVKNDQGT